MDIQTPDRTRKIALLNDSFRTSCIGGLIVLTRSVAGMDEMVRRRIMLEVTSFTDFNEDNDAHGEHDFGSFTLNQQKYFWKIDCYDKTMEMGSEDPANPHITKRVLTVMKAEEY